MKMNIQNELRRIEKELKGLEKEVFKPALNSTLNREGRWATNESIREVSRVQDVKQKLLKSKVKTRRSTYATLAFIADADVRGITWGRLNPRVIGGTKRGPGRGVRAGKHRHRHGFIRSVAGGRGGTVTTQVLVRDVNHPDYDGRYPLRVLRVRLRQPFRIAFEKRSREAVPRVLKRLDQEIGYRVKRKMERIK